MHMELDGVAEVAMQRSSARPVNVAAATFPLIRRGYDPTQVQWYLQTLAEDLAEHEDRSARLEQTVSDLRRELTQVARIDEATVANFLGEESARLLAMARDTAQNLVKRSEEKATNTVAAARAIAADLRAEVEQEIAKDRREVEEEVNRLRREANTETSRLRSETETETRRLRRETEMAAAKMRQETESGCSTALQHAQDRADRIVAEAEAQRTGVLADLLRRRELASRQLRDLMAGRDAIVASLADVEQTSRRLTADLESYSLTPAPFVNLADEPRDRVVLDDSAIATVRRLSLEAGRAAGEPMHSHQVAPLASPTLAAVKIEEPEVEEDDGPTATVTDISRAS